MKSDSSSKGTTKDNSNLEGDIENTLTLSGHDDKLNENDQTQVRLQAFAQEAIVEARTTVQGNHQELLDRKIKSTNTKAAVPVAPLRSFEEFAEEVKEEDRATLDNHEDYLEKKLQAMAMDGIVANKMPEDSTKIALMMIGNEPETETQKTKATPGAVAIMGTNSHLMVQSNQFVSVLNVNESTIPESTDTTTPHQMEEQPMHYAAATLVVDEYTSPVDPPVLANATKVDTQAIEQAVQRRQVKAALVSFVLAIAAAGITYAIYASTRPKNVVDAPNETLTLNPSASPSNILRTIIANQSFDNGTALLARGSPQNQAFQWIEDNVNATLLNSTAELLQLYSLVTLYRSTPECEWNQSQSNVGSTPWLEGIEYCSWGGVACNHDGSILTSLNLRNMNLTGSIPIELGHLSGLENLDLGMNAFRGKLSSEIGFLTNLIVCQVDNNFFTGLLPSELGQLTSLTFLSVAFNQFGGISKESGRLTDLTNVFLDTSPSQGTLPTEIALLTQLTHFDIEGNIMSGKLPTELGHLVSLTTLTLSHNQFSGSIPSEIGLLSNLEILYLAYNAFSGILPTEIGQLANLTYLELFLNIFTGTIPTEIGYLTNLDSFSLSYNRLTGTLPSEFGLLTILTEMTLAVNNFKGTIPVEIGNMTNLEIFALSENHFSGNLSTEIAYLSSLSFVSLGSNNFTGTIPLEVQHLTNLFFLDLSLNQFEGTLPTEIGLLKDLLYFILSSNLLGGKIPTEIGQLTLLEGLYLDENKFSGTVPTEVGQLNTLIVVDFSGNPNLTGAVPVEVCDIDALLSIQYCPPLVCNCTNCTFFNC